MARYQPILTLRKHAKPRRVKDPGLRAVLQFVLRGRGAGRSARDVVMFYKVLDVWCDSMPGAVVGEGTIPILRDVFASPHV